MTESFAAMLTGGHPNSLGRTIEVVDQITADPARIAELFECYFADDPVVRLRTSNAFKRLWRAHPDWVAPYIDRFLNEIAALDQPSAQWTVAQMIDEMDAHFTPDQRAQGIAVLKRLLPDAEDWIVINQSLDTLAARAKKEADLRAWLLPHLTRFAADSRKSVAGKAAKLLKALA